MEGTSQSFVATVSSCVIVLNSSLASNSNLAEDSSDLLKCAFDSDAKSLAAAFKQLQAVDICQHENLSVVDILEQCRTLKGAEENAAVFVVESVGQWLGNQLFLRCADGKWISILRIVREIEDHSDCALSLILIHAVEPPELEELPLDLVDSVTGQDQNIPDSILLFWVLSPRHPFYLNRRGTVMMQVIADQLQARAEHITVQEILLCSQDIVSWYMASKDATHTCRACPTLCIPHAQLMGGVIPCRLAYNERVIQPSFAPTGNTLIDNDGALVHALPWQSHSIHTGEVKVTIFSGTQGADIYYTTDGSVPAPGHSGTSKYKKPVVLFHTGDGHCDFQVKALAFKEGMMQSRLGQSPIYRVQGKTQPVSFEEIRHMDEVLLTMRCTTPGATIYYEEGDKQPTGRSTKFEKPVRVRSKLIRAFARADKMTDSCICEFELKAQAEVPIITASGQVRFSSELAPPQREVFLDEVLIEITSSAEGLDGYRCFYDVVTASKVIKGRRHSTYATCSKRYEAPIRVASVGCHSVSAFVTANGTADSGLAWARFEVQNQVSGIMIEPMGGRFKRLVRLTASCKTQGAKLLVTIHAWPCQIHGQAQESLSLGPELCRMIVDNGQLDLLLDRTDDRLFAPGAILAAFQREWSQPLRLRVRVMGYKAGMIDSDGLVADFELLEQVETPHVTPEPGGYMEYVDVSLSCATLDASIHFTLDESPPHSDSPVYSGIVRIDKVGMTLVRARAYRAGMWESDEIELRFYVLMQAVAWGTGASGQLGYGGFESQIQPIRVSSLVEYTIVGMAGGRGHSVLVSSNGEVLTFGCNLYGRLGLGDSLTKGQRIPIPTRINALPVKIKQASLPPYILALHLRSDTRL